MIVASLLAVATIVGLAIGSWVFVMGSKEIGQDSQERANRAADREPAFVVQTAHLAWEGDDLILHVVAGPDSSSTEVPLSAMPIHMDAFQEEASWDAFRDADGSLDQEPPLLNGGDLVEYAAPVDPESLLARSHITLGTSSQVTIQVPAHIGPGITALTILG